MKRLTTGCCLIAVTAFAFSPSVFAQQNEPCFGADETNDLNGDGYVDAYLSPDAKVIESDIDCSNHTIEAGAFIKRSNLTAVVSIAPGARIVDSGVSFFASVGEGAKIIDSGVDGEGTMVAGGAIVRNGSVVSNQSWILSGAIINASRIDNSIIGERTVIRNSPEVIEFEVAEDVKVNGARLVGNPRNGQGGVLGEGSIVREGSLIQGPITVLQGARIGKRASLIGDKFVGDNFRLGADSFIDFGGDILGNVRIGKNVTIGSNPRIGNENRIGAGTTIGSNLQALNNVTIAKAVTMQAGVFIGERSIIRRDSIVGFDVEIGADVVIGRGSMIGDDVIIGDSVVVRAGSNVPAGAVIPAGSIYPDNGSTAQF